MQVVDDLNKIKKIKGEKNMEEKTSYGWIILIFLFFILFNNGGVFGLGNRGCDRVGYACNDISNCDVRTQGIINTAQTQFLIEQRTADTNALVQATSNALGQKIDFYAYESLKDQLAQERTKNVVLENRLYSDAQFNALQAQNTALATQIASLSCSLPKVPPIYAQSYTPCGSLIPVVCGSSTSTTTNNGGN